jgi:hypothetical protein
MYQHHCRQVVASRQLGHQPMHPRLGARALRAGRHLGSAPVSGLDPELRAAGGHCASDAAGPEPGFARRSLATAICARPHPARDPRSWWWTPTALSTTWPDSTPAPGLRERSASQAFVANQAMDQHSRSSSAIIYILSAPPQADRSRTVLLCGPQVFRTRRATIPDEVQSREGYNPLQLSRMQRPQCLPALNP